MEFGKAGWINKARQQPDKVRQVFEKIRTDGLLPALDAVRNKLDQPLAMGYCNAGVVVEAGAGVSGFRPGDRVVSNGKHAEVVNVPANLCAKIPDRVSDDEAAFTVLGAVALQGIRLVQPALGEAVVVSGLGLVGLLAVQLLRAHGCRVLGLDFDTRRLHLAKHFGAEVVDISTDADPVTTADVFTRGRGVDAVLITASTQSSEPVRQAARMSRKRGRIVLVGVTGLELSRSEFYEKELTFQVSCSYGPGRYDTSYEEKGQDYPVGFVRWTAQRNFEAVLDMMAEGRLDVRPLISHRFALEQAPEAYRVIAGREASLGVLLEYFAAERKADSTPRSQSVFIAGKSDTIARPTLGFIGAGNYATAILMPAFKRAGARLKTVASNGGVSALHAARKFGFEEATTEAEALFADPEIDAIVIVTRHDSHAALVCRALRAGKHVFVEKPLAMDREGLAQVELACSEVTASGRPPLLMVGFNRRFAPHVQRIKQLLSSVPAPKAFIVTVNAGAIPANHWTRDGSVGGGRLIGEACHFIDLIRFLADSQISDCRVARLGDTQDTFTISLSFIDGSVGTVHYLSNGSRAFPKERLEVFTAGRVLQLDNFRRLIGYGWGGFSAMTTWRQDKGQRSCSAAFLRALEDGTAAPIPLDELLEVSRVTVDAAFPADRRIGDA